MEHLPWDKEAAGLLILTLVSWKQGLGLIPKLFTLGHP